MPGLPKATRRGGRRPRRRRRRTLRARLLRSAILLCTAIVVATAAGLAFFYVSFGRMIDARLQGERERTTPRIYARPVELRRGQAISEPELIARLNDLGYAERARVERPGEFAVLPAAVVMRPRGGPHAGLDIRVTFPPLPRTRAASTGPVAAAEGIHRIDVDGSGAASSVQLDAPLLTALVAGGTREKRRHVPLAAIPAHVQQAVLAIEDQSFYAHPGVNPFRVAAAAVTNLFGDRGAPVGNSTITQQLSRMFFQADAFNAELQRGSRSYVRYLQGALMSLVLERRVTKPEILELYLNDVYLGQRGSFAIHGVAEGARIFFGKDVANLTISEGALLAGVIQSPATRSPFTNAGRAVERRNVVIRAMAGEGFITQAQAASASREPLRVVARSVDNEAPYFVDLVGGQVAGQFPDLATGGGAVHVYTTLDLNLQRAAVEAVRQGLDRVDRLLARRARHASPQAALLAVQPRTGEILALVGGRSYNQSQYNRAVHARRQPGSVFKPFVYLAAFERAADEGLTDFTPAAIARDEPHVFEVNGEPWEPRNYDEYDGEITWRRALAMSRNLATIHVGAQAGFDRVAALWRRVGVGTPPRAYPSIALGVFELTPLEVAQAYTLFVNGGSVRPLRALERIEAGALERRPERTSVRQVARPQTAFLVTHMMRSVIDEGTGAGARAAGFRHAAAGKSGTTNDLRDAWFVGFTPELLAVVWVGYDDNQPLSLTGTQAALPIWTDFMKRATAGRPDTPFVPPADGVTFAEIDPGTGLLATPSCPGTLTESFLAGTEPARYCELHR